MGPQDDPVVCAATNLGCRGRGGGTIFPLAIERIVWTPMQAHLAVPLNRLDTIRQCHPALTVFRRLQEFQKIKYFEPTCDYLHSVTPPLTHLAASPMFHDRPAGLLVGDAQQLLSGSKPAFAALHGDETAGWAVS